MKKKGKVSLLKSGLIGSAVGFVVFLVYFFLDVDAFDNFINIILTPFFIFYNFVVSNLIFVFIKSFSILIFYFIFLVIEGFLVGVIVGFLLNKVKNYGSKK